MSYATGPDVRAWGIPPEQQADALVTDRLLVATQVIDDYCGLTAWGLSGGFAAQSVQTFTFADVRLPLVTLPKPIQSITSVTVDGRVIDPTQYIFDANSGSMRLYQSGYLDVDGFPRRSQASVGYGYRGFGAPYGSQVSVTATFGYAVCPVPVRHACILITAFLLSQGGETFVDPRVTMVAVEGYAVRYPSRGGTGTELIDTTGVIEADRLLQPYRDLTLIQVA